MKDDNSDWGYGAASADAMRAYEETLARPLFDPWAHLLCDELALERGEALVDVATGPGTLARIAAALLGEEGRVTACDLSPAMLALARQKPSLPGTAPIEYLECPADTLTVPTGAYNVVACQQGLQFFPDRPAAVTEMARVLKPGGRIGIAVWSVIEHCPPIAALATAIAAVMGEGVATKYRSGPWGLGDPNELADLVVDAGFDEVRVEEHRLPVTFEGGTSQLLASLAASGIASEFAALEAQARQALVAEAEDALSPMVVEGRVVSTMASNIAIALKAP